MCYDWLPALAVPPIQRDAVISNPAAIALKACATTIPLALAIDVDPVQFS
jgi:hypothetical protein